MTVLRPVLIGLAAVVLVGLVAVLGLRSVAPNPTAVAPQTKAVAVEPTEMAEPMPTASTENVSDAPPPWAVAAASVDGSAAAAVAPERRREQQMAELQQSMSVVLDDALARSASSTEHLRKALDALEAMDDPTVKAQINLPALRHNLEISVRMQTVARQMRAEVGLPRSAIGDARIETLRQEFASLQAQMRTDVAISGGAIAPTTLPSPPAVVPPASGTPEQ